MEGNKKSERKDKGEQDITKKKKKTKPKNSEEGYCNITSNAALYKDLCLGFSTMQLKDTREKLLSLILNHTDFIDVNEKEGIYIDINDVEKKRKIWGKTHDADITNDDICAELMKLFIAKPFLLQEDMFTNRLPGEIKEMIIDYASSCNLNSTYLLYLNKTILRQIENTIKLKDKIRVSSIFNAEEGQAKMLAGLIIYHLRKPSAMNHDAVILISIQDDEGDFDEHIRLGSYYARAVMSVEENIVIGNEISSRDFEDNDIAVTFPPPSQWLKHHKRMDKKILVSEDFADVINYYDDNRRVLTGMKVKTCFAWLSALIAHTLKTKGINPDSPMLEVRFMYISRSTPTKYPLLFPEELSTLKISELTNIEIKQLPQEAQQLFNMYGVTSLGERRPYFLITACVLRSMHRDIVKDMATNALPKNLPDDVKSDIKKKLESGKPITDLDILYYLYAKSYDPDIKRKAIFYTMTERDFRSLSMESTQFRVAAADSFIHIKSALGLAKM
jgi:hypothetical protein